MADLLLMPRVGNFQSYTLNMVGGMGTASSGTATVNEAFTSQWPSTFPIYIEIWDTDETYAGTREIIRVVSSNGPARQFNWDQRNLGGTSIYNHANGSKCRIVIVGEHLNNAYTNIEAINTELIAATSAVTSLTSGLATTNTNLTTTNSNVTALTTRVTTVEGKIAPTAGTIGTNPANNGVSTFTARLDHEHKVVSHIPWITGASPTTGDNSAYLINKWGYDVEILGVEFYTKTAGSSSTIGQVYWATRTNYASGVPSWASIFSSPPTLGSGVLITNTATISHPTWANGEMLKFEIATVGSGVGTVGLQLTIKAKNTN